MTVAAPESWTVANQRYLSACLRELACRLGGEELDEASAAVADAAAALPGPAAIDLVTTAFGLSAFERAIVLLCAGVELDGTLAERCAQAQGDPRRTSPTFGFALATLPDAHWSALVPAAPLRRWNLVTIAREPLLTASSLRIEERILHFLTGIDQLDERLADVLVPLEPAIPGDAAPIVEALCTLWERPASGTFAPVQLHGGDAHGRRTAVAAAAQQLNVPAWLLHVADVPQEAAERAAFARAWDRERRLNGALLVVDGQADPANSGWERFVKTCEGRVALLGATPVETGRAELVRLELETTSFETRRNAWQRALGGQPNADGIAERLAAQFHLDPGRIDGAAAQARAGNAGALDADVLWEVCRRLVRPALESVAERIQATWQWDDLVLPAHQKNVLREIEMHVRLRHTVHEAWGFGAASQRGLGIAALFAGPSGTGKTMAAEVLGNALHRDVYRIDLAAVVSKYIGETEKNLKRIFDAAESGAAILLFDEADALFGKRSEIRDSHDRYANIEVSYLLQRMEAYRGLAILTTNLKSSLDSAFLRRLRFIVHFPFPDVAERTEIWQRVFPADAPTDGLRYDQLARLNLSGGTIRNVAIASAFLAADEGTPVRMPHLARAARSEFAKLEKPLSEADIAGWR
jgi:hypothetical protein